MTWDDRKRSTSISVDLDGNEATVTVVEREETTISDLFDENGELRLWEDGGGWSGYRREGGDFYRVNMRRDREDVTHEPVSRDDVIESVSDHVADPHAGRVGKFVRAATPPRSRELPEPVRGFYGGEKA